MCGDVARLEFYFLVSLVRSLLLIETECVTKMDTVWFSVYVFRLQSLEHHSGFDSSLYCAVIFISLYIAKYNQCLSLPKLIEQTNWGVEGMNGYAWTKSFHTSCRYNFTAQDDDAMNETSSLRSSSIRRDFGCPQAGVAAVVLPSGHEHLQDWNWADWCSSWNWLCFSATYESEGLVSIVSKFIIFADILIKVHIDRSNNCGIKLERL